MKSKTAMIFGLLDTFYDEQAKFHEVRKSLQRILRKLHEMKKSGVSILIASLEMKVLPEERNQLFRIVKASVDQLYRLEVGEGQYRLVLESTRNDSAKKKENHHGTLRSNIHIPHSRGSSLVDKIQTRVAERRSGNL